MKTLKRIFALCLVAGAFLVFSGFGGDNNAAVVEKGIGCFVNWAAIDDDYGYSEVVWTNETILVSNNGGNVMLTCQFTDVANPPMSIVKGEGFDCGTSYGITNDSKALVTPDGDGMLKCMIKE